MVVKNEEAVSVLKIIQYGQNAGILPFVIRYRYNNYNLSYSFVHNIGLSLMVIGAALWSYFRWLYPVGNFSKIILLLHIISNIWTPCIFILIFSFRGKALLNFVKYMNQVDELLKNQQNYKADKDLLIKISIFGFIVIFLLITYDVAFSCRGNSWEILNAFIYHAVFYFNISVLLIYKSLVAQIEKRITCLRKLLLEFTNDESEEKPENIGEVFVTGRIPSRNTQNEKISGIHTSVKIYGYIFSAIQEFEVCFGPILLTVTMLCLVNLIFIPFIIYVDIVRYQQRACNVSFCIGLLIAQVIKIILISEPWHSCLNKIKQFTHQLVRMSCNNSPSSKYMRDFYRMVEDCPITLWMCGIMPLNRCLLQYIMVGVTTYLVIVFQIKDVLL